MVIDHEKLLEAISCIYAEQGFTVLPFYHFDEVPSFLFTLGNLFVWEVHEVNPTDVKWASFLKGKETLKFVLIDLLEDEYLMSIIKDIPTASELYEKSFKIRDLIHMSKMVFNKKNPFMNLDSYLKGKPHLFKESINDGSNYLEMAENTVKHFLKEYNLEVNINDVDLLFLALGEVIENFVGYQMNVMKKKPEIVLEYGFDDERIIISARDKLGEADLLPLFQSFIRKISIDPPVNHPDYDENGLYVGNQGRGMNIIKKSVHRLISIVKRQADEFEDKRTQFIFIVYLDKEIVEENSSINMIVFS